MTIGYLDLSTLVVIDILTIVVVSTMLLIGRLTLGRASDGSGVRVVSDVLMCLANVGALVDASPAFAPWVDGPVWHLLPAVALPGALVLAAQWWHARALAIVGGQRIALHRVALESMLPAAAWLAVATFMLNDFDTRHQVLCGFIVAGALPSMPPAWRLARRFWGARVILAVLVLTAAMMALLAAGAGPGVERWSQGGLAKSFLLQNVVLLTMSLGFLVLVQEKVRQQLSELSRTDPLTGLLNRRGLLDLLARDLDRAQRSQRPLSLALFDIDHFKMVNDQEGHDGGDVVLQRFAQGMLASCRRGDMAARWGGEEFVLVMPDTTTAQAAGVAERLRRATRAAPLTPSGKTVTVSGGVAGADLAVASCNAIDRLLKGADGMLYHAKQTRDRVCVEGADTAIGYPEKPAAPDTPQCPTPTPTALPPRSEASSNAWSNSSCPARTARTN